MTRLGATVFLALIASAGVSSAQAAASDRVVPLAFPREELPVLDRPTNGENICLFDGNRVCPPTEKLDGWKVDEAPPSPACSEHFCIHWIEETQNAPKLADRDGDDRPFEKAGAPDNDGIPDYVEEVAVVAEKSWRVQIDRLGWRPPVPDGDRGGDARTDIYLFAFDRIPDFAGLAVTDPVPGRGERQRSGYVMIDDDYDDPAYYPTPSPRRVLETLVPHEFAHLVQFAHDGTVDSFMLESSAEWLASVTYKHPQYYAFVDPLTTTTTQPLSRAGFRSYVLTVWNEWLASRLGPVVVRRAWEVAETFPRQVPHSLASYDLAIRQVSGGRSSFADQFIGFAAATAEWSRRDFPAANASEDIERLGTIEPDGDELEVHMNRASWAVYDVPTDDDAGSYELEVEVDRDVPGGFALVGRANGRVVRSIRRTLPDGTASVRLAVPRGGFDRLSAVLVNAHPRARDYARGANPKLTANVSASG